MNRLITIAAIAVSVLVATTALAKQDMKSELRDREGPDVIREGRIYHARTCRSAIGPGIARCHARFQSNANGDEVMRERAAVTPNALPSGLNPADLRAAYKVPTTSATKRTIAIVDAYGYPNAEADLAVYRATYGLPACTTANGCFKKVSQTGSTTKLPAYNLGWAQETALDLDMASAICPDCKIVLVQATNSTLANLATAVNYAASLGVAAISNSYGGSETGTTSYESAYNHPGIAITVSSGDSGYGVEFPASSNHVVAVGGTSLTRASNARGWSEAAWSGSGSGCSTLYAKPSWQTDPRCAKRMVADVSAVADPATGVAVYAPTSSSRAAWLVFGGTSASAPIIAGIYASQGAAGASYPAQDLYTKKAYLFDVFAGSNGSCGSTYLCTSVTGYDGPTGLGTPNGLTAF